MIDFVFRTKSNPHGSLFRFPAMDPGAARDRVKRISGCRCIDRRACYALQIFVLPYAIYQRSVSPVQSWFMDRDSLFQCIQPSILLHRHFRNFHESQLRNRKSCLTNLGFLVRWTKRVASNSETKDSCKCMDNRATNTSMRGCVRLRSGEVKIKIKIKQNIPKNWKHW